MPFDPDDKPANDALRKAGVSEHMPNCAVEKVPDVAAANLIAQFMANLDAKLDARDAKLDARDAKLDARDAKLDAHSAKLDAISAAMESRTRILMWMIGAAVALIGILLRLWT